MPVMDPFLESINHILMEEAMDDSTCLQLDRDASYQAIFRSFYDIIGDHPPSQPSYRTIFRSFYDVIGENPAPKSSVDSSSYESLDALHFAHQIPETQHVMGYSGFDMLNHHLLNSGASTVTLPAIGNLQSSFSQEETADTSLLVPGLAQHFASPNSANLNALSTTKAQHHHAAIKFNDGELMGNLWGKQKQGYDHFQLPSPYKNFSLKLTGVELSFEDLKLHDSFAALYVGERSVPAGAPNYGYKERGLAMASKGCKSGRKRTADVQEYVDLKELIVNCAQAVAVGDARAANDILQLLRHEHGASADGNGSQRAVYYFSEALEARMRGTGGLHFRALKHKKPAAATILKAYKQWFDVSPLVQVTHYFANQSILKAAERASRLHIVDYGLDYGMQWPCLINALADQKGGPPLLVITAIDSPQLGNNPSGRLEESGRRLAAYARTYNVPFQYHAIASSKWENLDSSSFHFHEDEVLVVNCIKGLLHLADESADFVSARQKFLTCIHSLKPHLLITADVSAGYNTSFFVSRFRDALYYYSNLFDMVDTLWPDDSPERQLKERICFFRDILNIVACEGSERVERPETYKQWEVRIKRAGFKQLLIPPGILSRSRSHVKQHYHREFIVDDEANKWMLLGWRGRTLLGISAWERSHVQASRKEG